MSPNGAPQSRTSLWRQCFAEPRPLVGSSAWWVSLRCVRSLLSAASDARSASSSSYLVGTGGGREGGSGGVSSVKDSEEGGGWATVNTLKILFSTFRSCHYLGWSCPSLRHERFVITKATNTKHCTKCASHMCVYYCCTPAELMCTAYCTHACVYSAHPVLDAPFSPADVPEEGLVLNIGKWIRSTKNA